MIENPHLKHLILLKEARSEGAFCKMRSTAMRISPSRSRSSLIAGWRRAKLVRGFSDVACARSRHLPGCAKATEGRLTALLGRTGCDRVRDQRGYRCHWRRNSLREPANRRCGYLLAPRFVATRIISSRFVRRSSSSVITQFCLIEGAGSRCFNFRPYAVAQALRGCGQSPFYTSY